MKGTVTAKSGSTVKLRQKPGTDCTIYWNIPVGTEMEIVDQRENWSKCICSGLTGWMKNEFIRTGGEEDLPVAPEPSVSEDQRRSGIGSGTGAGADVAGGCVSDAAGAVRADCRGNRKRVKR